MELTQYAEQLMEGLQYYWIACVVAIIGIISIMLWKGGH